MKIGSAEVKTDKRTRSLGPVDFCIYDSVDEAINHPEHGLGPIKVLELINTQVKTNAMNNKRAQAKGPTKTLLRSEAMTEVVAEIAAGNHPNAIGNKAVLESLIEQRMAVIAQRIKDSTGAGIEEDEEEEAA